MILHRFVCCRTAAAAFAAVLVLAGPTASAQAFPVKPIRFFVPYAPGGVGDLTARMVAQKMSESLGQQVLIENRPSAGLVLATEAAAKADPDGYTITLTGNGSALSVSMFAKLPYDVLNDFVHVSTIGFFDIGLVVDAASPLRTVAEVLAAAKASPGKLNIGTISIGSTQHLAAELFKSVAGVNAVTVPFKSSGAVITALRGKEIDLAFEILAPVMPQLRANALRVVAIGSDKRFAALPDVPTIAESGVAGYQASSWNGISVTAKTPAPIVERLNRAIVAAVNQPDVRSRFQELGVEARAGTPAEMRALMAADIAKWKAVIERANIARQ